MSIDPKPNIVYEDLEEDEKKVYDEAFSRFAKTKYGTYEHLERNPELREKLRKEFAGHCVMMYRRSRKSRWRGR